jgi:hypothetical protein
MIDCEQEDIVEAVGHIYSANRRRALVLTHLAWGLSAVVIGLSDLLHFVAHFLTSGFLPLLIGKCGINMQRIGAETLANCLISSDTL